MTRGQGVRAILIGALLVLLLTALTLHSNLRYGRYITAASLPSGAIFFFVVALLVNAGVYRIAPRIALSRAELALIFSMLFISAALPQASVAETLVTLIVAPRYFPRGDPAIKSFDNKPASWLTLANDDAIARFYAGYGPAGGPVPWNLWIVPLLGWSVFVLLLLFALYCLSRMFTNRWVREERITFPLMELPLELLGQTHDPVMLWRRPLMYLGALLPATMIVVGQLHSYYPSVPEWQQIISFPVGEAFLTPPLSALSDFKISIWPMVVGLSYLISAEVAVSIWAFHLLFWAQLVFWAWLGYPWQQPSAGSGGFQPLEWIHSTEFGAALVLAALLLLTVRKDIQQAGQALLRGRTNSETELPIPPWAVGGFLLATLLMVGWGWAAGGRPLLILIYLLFLYAILIALGRMVAAGGLYLVDNGYEPQSLLYALAGTGGIDPGSHFVLAGQEALFGRADMSFFYFAVNDNKIAAETRTASGRWHGAGVAVAVTLALAAAYGLILLWSYRYGAATFSAWPLKWRVPQTMERTIGFLNALQKQPNVWTWAGTITGMGIALVLIVLHRRFLWWPLVPFGFVVASSWNISNQIWSSVLIGWLCASLIRRYGGLTLYRNLRPLFLGLILGDAVTFCLMAVVESIVGVPGKS